MKLRIIRLVIANFGTRIQTWPATSHTDGAIAIKPFFSPPVRVNSNSTTDVILEASQEVDTIDANDGVIYIPPDLHRQMEAVIESHVDIVAVMYRCTRSIASPHPHIAIEPLDEDAVNWLKGKRIHKEIPALPVRMWHEFDFLECLPLLADRQDGVTLLAESLGHSHPTGRLHELMRLFERAFAQSAGKVCRDHLPKFLSQNTFAYSAAEVEHWLELRDTTAHADRRAFFGVHADTYPVVNRVEQAAYDVLFNKMTWRDASISRRNALQPFCGSSANDSSIFITKGAPASLEFQTLDDCLAYPLNVNAGISTIPPHWLTKSDDPANLGDS